MQPLCVSPCALCCTLDAQLKRHMMEIHAMLPYIMDAPARLGSPIRPPLLFLLPNQAGVREADLGSEFPSLTGTQVVRQHCTTAYTITIENVGLVGYGVKKVLLNYIDSS